jgi:delta 1-pyrroline-5-carboxylate dehydrogenase
MPFTNLAQQMERLLTKIHHHAPHDELYMEALPLFKELSILEDRNKSSGGSPLQKYDEVTDAHISKAQRKLMKWAHDPEGMPSKILDVYAYLLKVPKKSFIDITLLEQTFKSAKEDVSTFRQNFDQMKNFAEKNHAKIFDVQPNGHIAIWPPVRQYVEHYWDISAIRQI